MKIDITDKVSYFSDLTHSRIHSHLFFNQKDRHLSEQKTSWSTFKTILLEIQMAIEFCKYICAFEEFRLKLLSEFRKKRKSFTVETTAKKRTLERRTMEEN